MAVSFLVFADLHHEPKVFPHDAKRFLDEIIARGINAKVSFMVQLGDFLHTPQENRALADVFAEAPIPAYNVFGNHDNDQESYEYILDMYRLKNGYYYFDREGYRFIVLDPNYSVVNGELVHYNPNQARSHNRGEIPPDQMSWLEETICGSPFPCVLFSHQSLERTDGIKNRDEVWRIICRANRSREHAVILCVNGHYHCDYCTFMNGVCCLDLNSSSYYWTDPTNRLYPQEVYDKFPISDHCIFYKNPLSAVVTLTGTDRITVEGSGGEFLYPIDRDELFRLDQRRLSDLRVCTPYISDYSVDLNRQIVEKREKSVRR